MCGLRDIAIFAMMVHAVMAVCSYEAPVYENLPKFTFSWIRWILASYCPRTQVTCAVDTHPPRCLPFSS